MDEKNMDIKALFFDIDSTLYDHKIHDFPQSTKAALHTLFASGFRVYIATSRSEEEMVHVWEKINEFPFHGIITNGGAMTRVGEEVVEFHTLNDDDAKMVVDYCREHNIDVRWQGVNQCYFDKTPSQRSKDVFDYLYQMIPEVKPWNGEHLLSLLLFTDHRHRKSIGDLVSKSALIYYQNDIEITGHQINKATAIERMALRDGFTMDQVACFGDGENDVQMLQKARLGVAMGNGVPLAKAAADFVTKNIDDDGIAYACQYFGFI